MTTNTKAIIDKNKRHILACYKGNGGAKQFVNDVDQFTRSYRITPRKAILEYICEYPRLLFETDRINEYLISLGFDKRRVERDDYDSWYYYKQLMARDGEKLYYDLKKKGVEKTKKSIAVKKKASGPFGL